MDRVFRSYIRNKKGSYISATNLWQLLDNLPNQHQHYDLLSSLENDRSERQKIINKKRRNIEYKNIE
jgi:hypothetical protein